MGFEPLVRALPRVAVILATLAFPAVADWSAHGFALVDARPPSRTATQPASAPFTGPAATGPAATGPADEEEAPASPFSFSLDYSLYSDYVFRGINLSEHEREGSEAPNHQATVSLSADASAMFGGKPGLLGSVGFEAWFEWYNDQAALNPDVGGQNLQEFDFTLSWSYEVEPLATTVTVGHVFYRIPNSETADSSELLLRLEHNDAWMWRGLWPDNEEGVLNPSFAYWRDVDLLSGAQWFEFGASHDFALTEALTVTPGVTLAVDHRYLGPALAYFDEVGTQIAYVQYALSVEYDLSGLLRVPSRLGSVSLSGFISFNDALGHPERNQLIQDELFGGIGVTWSF